MPSLTIKRGDSFNHQFQTPIGSTVTLAEGWFTLKRDASQSDSEAILQVTITGGLVVLNGTPVVSPNTAKAALSFDSGTKLPTLIIDASITAQLDTLKGVWDIQTIDNSGIVSTLDGLTGDSQITGDVTRATS